MTLRMPGVPYLGPPDTNWGGSTVRPPLGMVVHIAEGSYQGTIGWQRNPVADVSSYFVTSRAGEIAQMLDLDLMAWTQASGNPTWVGVENEGFHTQAFTDAQIDANARIFAWLRQVWPSIPARISNAPGTGGLGWHGMGGAAWGNHPDCPGSPNVALLPTILARATGGNPTPAPPQEDEDEDMKLLAPKAGYGAGGVVLQYPTDLGLALQVIPVDGSHLAEVTAIYGQEKYVDDSTPYGTPIAELVKRWQAMGGSSGGAPAGPFAVSLTGGLSGSITPK